MNPERQSFQTSLAVKGVLQLVEAITLGTAMLAGFVSFVSPCVLPIVPGFLSVITGIDITADAARRGNTRRIIGATSLFVVGFSIVFILLGLTATTFGSTVFRNQDLLTRISGVLLLVMGGYLLGSRFANAPGLYRDVRFHPRISKLGPFAAPVAGMAFGFGWTPCIGPILTSVLAVAASRGRAGEGAALLAAYSLGLGIPFIITGAAFGRVSGLMGFLKRHSAGFTVVSGASMALFGVLLVFNRLTWVTTQIQSAFIAVGLEELVFLG